MQLRRIKRRNDAQRSSQSDLDPRLLTEQIDSLTNLFLAILNDLEPSTHQMPIFVAVPGTHLKHKRNVKTREQQQKKKKVQAKHVTVHV